MEDDPIIAEIRRIRDEHAAKFDYDAHAIGEDLRRRQRESGRTYVSLPPRRIEQPLVPPVNSDVSLDSNSPVES
jgi:hypothetical protein